MQDAKKTRTSLNLFASERLLNRLKPQLFYAITRKKEPQIQSMAETFTNFGKVCPQKVLRTFHPLILWLRRPLTNATLENTF